MSAKISHSISSSESDTDCDDPTEIIEEKSRKPAPSERLNEILSKVKGIKYDFNQVSEFNSQQILFSNDISADDEIWLMQTPKGINLEALKSFDFNFDSELSQTTLKPRKKERKYNIYAVKCANEKMNCVLPERKTRSFHINVNSVAGRIILQEDFQMSDKEKDLNENTADSSLFDTDLNKTNISNATFDQSLDLEFPQSTNLTPKKKKRKSTIT